MRLWFFIFCPMLMLVFFIVGSHEPAASIPSEPIETESSWRDPILTNDIMPAIHRGEIDRRGPTGTDYAVTPFLFVPNDLTPHSLGLQTIDRQMQLFQRWYAEQ